MNHSPRNERRRRVLVVAEGVLIQLTLGSGPARTSAAKSSGKRGQERLLVERRGGFSYWEKYGQHAVGGQADLRACLDL